MKVVLHHRGKFIPMVMFPDDVGRHIERTRIFYEIEILDFLNKSFPYLKGTFVDVGANIGNHALYMFHFFDFKNIKCFEPHPETFEKLRKNIGGWEDSANRVSVQLFKVALADKEGYEYITTQTTNMGTNKLTEEETKYSVKIQRLDDYNLKEVSMIKIDVEGAERRVLDGAIETIKRDHPVLVIECADMKKIEDFLKKNKYKEVKAFPDYSTYVFV